MWRIRELGNWKQSWYRWGCWELERQRKQVSSIWLWLPAWKILIRVTRCLLAENESDERSGGESDQSALLAERWQETKVSICFSKKNFLKTFCSGDGGGEGERDGEKESSNHFNFSFKSHICWGHKCIFLVRFGMKSSGFSTVFVSS